MFPCIMLQHSKDCSKLQQALRIDSGTGGRVLWKRTEHIYSLLLLLKNIYPTHQLGNAIFHRLCCGPWMPQKVALTSLTIKASLEHKLNVVAFLPATIQLRPPFDCSVRTGKEWMLWFLVHHLCLVLIQDKAPKITRNASRPVWLIPSLVDCSSVLSTCFSEQYIYAKGLSLPKDQSKELFVQTGIWKYLWEKKRYFLCIDF